MSEYILLVLHKTDHSFGCYDVQSGKKLAEKKTNAYPHEICLSPDRRKIYIAEMGVRGVESRESGGNTIAVYNTKNLSHSSTINMGQYERPHGITSHKNGKLLITSESTKYLLIYDIKSETLIHAVYLNQECAHMVSVSPDGKYAYTANIFSNSITKVDVETGIVLKHIMVLKRPEGMVFSKDGKKIYVVNRESSAISLVDHNIGKQIETIKTGKGPVRIVMSPDGKSLAIPLFYSSALQIVDTDTRTISHTTSVGSHPVGISLSPDGKLVFVSCEDENLIYVLSMKEIKVISTIKTGPGCDAMLCFCSSEIHFE